ncbi:hypothetical protein ACEWY4_025192 [Coilia grayii]|uniref:Uncharacterized protein n=1 Tax=Coilia grayii TaxID=363190 RepID=A0ABD1IWV0_9TELE
MACRTNRRVGRPAQLASRQQRWAVWCCFGGGEKETSEMGTQTEWETAEVATQADRVTAEAATQAVWGTAEAGIQAVCETAEAETQALWTTSDASIQAAWETAEADTQADWMDGKNQRLPFSKCLLKTPAPTQTVQNMRQTLVFEHSEWFSNGLRWVEVKKRCVEARDGSYQRQWWYLTNTFFIETPMVFYLAKIGFKHLLCNLCNTCITQVSSHLQTESTAVMEMEGVLFSETMTRYKGMTIAADGTVTTAERTNTLRVPIGHFFAPQPAPGPDADAPGPNADAPGPEAGAPGPAPDAPGAEADAPGPDPGAPGPDAGTAAPCPDGPAPGAGARAPGSDGSGAPGPDAGTPGVAAAAPGPDAGAPGADAGAPGAGAGAGAPGPDAGAPDAGPGAPGPDAGAPDAGPGAPGADDGAPGADAGAPGPDAGLLTEADQVPCLYHLFQSTGLEDFSLRLGGLREAFAVLLAWPQTANFMTVAGSMVFGNMATLNGKDAGAFQQAFDQLVAFIQRPDTAIDAELLEVGIHQFNLLDVIFELVLLRGLEWHHVQLVPQAQGGFLDHLATVIQAFLPSEAWPPQAAQCWELLQAEVLSFLVEILSLDVSVYHHPQDLAERVFACLEQHIDQLLSTMPSA